ncbi:Dihydrouridine synthase [gamma proteobacterium HdN1]|nr:Dihydrouridine synthase [gamma proteobacterium HdN1]
MKSKASAPLIALAPMEGLVDAPMRAALTAMGGVDWCVTEFIRVTQSVLPTRTYQRLAPELEQQWKTASGTPLHVQFLGSDPEFLAANAVRAAKLGAKEIDLNFGCPAKAVNRHRGGAVLLEEPELLNTIVTAVRAAVPEPIKVTAKMRLGYLDKSLMLDCARALDEAGAARIVVHARTKAEGYRPPAHWHCIAQIADVVRAPVMANGEIWTVEDYLQCRRESGCNDVMLGRGLVARPDLALQIRTALLGEHQAPSSWDPIFAAVQVFYQHSLAQLNPTAAAGRLKSWLAHLRHTYPEASELYQQVRTQKVVAL